MIEVEGLLLVVGKVYGTVEGMLLRILAGMKKVDGVQYGVGGWWWWMVGMDGVNGGGSEAYQTHYQH
jgi:hypothetical protein